MVRSSRLVQLSSRPLLIGWFWRHLWSLGPRACPLYSVAQSVKDWLSLLTRSPWLVKPTCTVSMIGWADDAEPWLVYSSQVEPLWLVNPVVERHLIRWVYQAERLWLVEPLKQSVDDWLSLSRDLLIGACQVLYMYVSLLSINVIVRTYCCEWNFIAVSLSCTSILTTSEPDRSHARLCCTYRVVIFFPLGWHCNH